MLKKKIIISGAGLAGLSVAWHLQKKGIDCLIFEKEAEVGGVCRSTKLNGFIFDRGGHVFHFRNPYAFSFVKDLLGQNLKRHRRIALFYSFGRIGFYPFQANLAGMPRAIVRKCLAGAKTALSGNGRRNKEVDNLESWFISKFGNGIARYFLIPYNSKFWMVPLRSLTYEWAQQIVPVPTFDEIVSGATRKSAKKWGDNAIFWYPRKGGIHQLPLAMASELKNISTNCAVRRIDCEKRILETERGQKEKFDYLIMTIPLPELRGLLKNVPRKIERYFLMLRWNSIFNINLGIEGKAGWFCHWTYFPEKKISFFRSILPHRFSPSVVPRGRSSLSLEIAYKPGQPLDNNTLMKRAIKDAKKVGLLSGDQRISLAGCHDIAYGYPIHDHNYARARHEILRFLRKHHIICAGRYGGWRYMSMEDVILEGKAIAEL